MAKTNTKRKPKPERDDEAVVAPSTRVFTEWDPQRLRSAQLSAASGSLMLAAAVCDWLLTDDRVVGALGARLDALFGLDPTFEPSGDKRRSNRAVKALEAGEDWWTAYPESELRRMHSWGLLLGVAPARHQWTERADHGGRQLPMPMFWQPSTLRYEKHTRRWLIRDDKNVEHVIVAGDGEWILHTPYGASEPWLYGLWRSIANWVLLKCYARLDWARHGEKASLLVATAPDGATQLQRAALAADLQASGSDRVVALAAGFDLKLVEVSANTKDIYDAQVNAANDAIAILIRGGNLSTNVQQGSRAAAEVQERTGDLAKLRFDAATVATTLNEQSLAPWALYNFGDAKLAPWPVWPVDPPADLSKKAATLKAFGEAVTAVKAALGAGFKFVNLVELAEEFGIELEELPPQDAPAVVDKGTVGAQTDALLRLAEAVVGKKVPRKYAVNVLVKVFGMAEDEADKALDEIGKTFEPPPPTPNPFVPGAKPGEPTKPGDEPSDKDDVDDKDDDNVDDKDDDEP